LLDSTVRGNVARGGSTNTGLGGAAVGGGIGNQSGKLIMIRSTVADNQAIGGNGGSGFTGGLAAGGGLETSRKPAIPDLGLPPGGPASASVIDSVFSGNQAVGGTGGSGANGGNAVGGGINVGLLLGKLTDDNSTLTLTSSTLDHNLAQGGNGGKGGNGGDGRGGGLAVQDGSSATVSTSTITLNQA